MAKENIGVWVDDTAKRAIEAAARRTNDAKRGATGLIENIGLQLAGQVAGLPKSGAYKVEVQIVPVEEPASCRR